MSGRMRVLRGPSVSRGDGLKRPKILGPSELVKVLARACSESIDFQVLARFASGPGVDIVC